MKKSGEKVVTVPTNLQFQYFIHNSASLFRECSDHFLRGEIFHENFKIISKKIKIFLWKNLENKNSTSFLKKNLKILVERCKKGGYNMKSLTHNYYIITT